MDGASDEERSLDYLRREDDMVDRPSLPQQESTNENRFLVICCSSGWKNWTSKAVKIIDTGVAIGPNVVGEITYKSALLPPTRVAKCHRFDRCIKYTF